MARLFEMRTAELIAEEHARRERRVQQDLFKTATRLVHSNTLTQVLDHG